MTFNETELLARADAPAGIGPNPTFMQLLFELPVGEVSEPVATARGEAILKPVEVKAAGPAAFADVKARVKADLVRKKQEETALAAARAAMTPGASLEDVAKTAGVKVETPEAFPKAGPVPGLGTSKALLDAAFSAAVGETKGPVWVADRGAAVFRVLEVTPFDAARLREAEGRRPSTGCASRRPGGSSSRSSRGCAPRRASRSTRSSSPASPGRPDRDVIGRLSGIVLEKRPDRALVDASGVGYELHVPLGTFASLPGIGERASLHVHTHVREDAILLFGFATSEEKALFERLITVSGIGPKLALVGPVGPPAPRARRGDRRAERDAPLVDPRRREEAGGTARGGAEGQGRGDPLLVLRVDGLRVPAALGGLLDDAVGALVNLGYRKPQAEAAVKAASDTVAPADLPALLSAALRLLSR